MEAVSLSIIVPVYNVREYLNTCIDSVIGQTFKEWELILINDGSEDGSDLICEEYSHKHTRVKVIHQKNQGHTAARQAGLNAAAGEYIAFLDSDDWIEANMYKAMMAKAEEYQADIVQCNYRSVKGDRNIEVRTDYLLGIYTKEELAKTIYTTMIYGGEYFKFGIAPNLWNKLFKKELAEKFLFGIDHKIKSGEDGLFTYACFLEAERVFIMWDSFYNYRSREVSMCRITDNSRLEQNHLLFQCYEGLINKYPFLRKQMYYYVVYQTLQAVEFMEKEMSLKQIIKQNSHIFKDSLEQESIKNVKITEVKGKKNKLRLLGLKL